MKILVLFAALAISHLTRWPGRFKHSDRWVQWAGQLARLMGTFSARGLVSVLIIAVLGGALISAVAYALGGLWAWAVMAVAVLLLTLGPGDLDRDVEQAIDTSATESSGSEALGITAQDDAHEAGTQVYLAALTRWFGILFWFVVLGIPGALLYRLTERVCADPDDDLTTSDWVYRLRFFLEWPVLVLMVISSALTNDFDRVYQAWHHHRRDAQANDQSPWLIGRHLLVEICDVVLPEGLDQRGGIQLAHHFVWRLLILWLVVLSVLLLAGWLS